MPVYDRKCRHCEWLTDFALEPVTDPHPPCPTCGAETERYFAGHGPMVIPDSFSTPIVDSVMTNKKQIHYTRTERKLAMKKNRLQEFIRWTPGNESDKSSFCQREETISRIQLEKWEAYFKERYPEAKEQIVAPGR